MRHEITGIHHVTALAGAPGVNLAFYTKVLGLRLVKRTVNFDDPSSYHFYFGDRVGRPGTLMTFFPHPLAREGRAGAGEVARTSFAVPRGSIGGWEKRLAEAGVASTREKVGTAERLVFVDEHGTRLAAEEREDTAGQAGHGTSIRGIAGVTAVVNKVGPTAEFVTKVLGFRELARTEERATFAAPVGSAAPVLELIADPDSYRPLLGAGSVHHVAWRVADEGAQLRVRESIERAGVGVTEVRDRKYFKSIYFREPGGVIFEVATDGPGFLVDEGDAELGSGLMLPEQFESHRAEIERALPVVEVI